MSLNITHRGLAQKALDSLLEQAVNCTSTDKNSPSNRRAIERMCVDKGFLQRYLECLEQELFTLYKTTPQKERKEL